MTRKHALGMLVALICIVAVFHGVYAGLNAEPSGWGYFAWYVAFWWVLTTWVVTDARERGLPLAFDQGLFVYVAWPVYIPVYLVRSRGPEGLLWVVAVFLLYGVTLLITAFTVRFAWIAANA